MRVYRISVCAWHKKHKLNFIYITRFGLDAVLEKHPAIVKIICIAGPELHGKAWFTKAGQLAHDFQNLSLIDLHSSLRSRILSLRWKGPVYRYSKLGLQRRLFRLFHSKKLQKQLEQSTVPQRYSLALEASPPAAVQLIPKIHLSTSEAALGAITLAASCFRHGKHYDNFVVLHPYATHPNKAWPRKFWGKLANQLTMAQIAWIVIGQNEHPLFPEDPRDLTNKSSLRETCAILKAGDVLVTNDSGPMHLAAGVGTPIVALFGPTAKAWGFYPQGEKDIVIEQEMACRPCSLHGKHQCRKEQICLANIQPGTVLEAILRILLEGKNERSLF